MVGQRRPEMYTMWRLSGGVSRSEWHYANCTFVTLGLPEVDIHAIFCPRLFRFVKMKRIASFITALEFFVSILFQISKINVNFRHLYQHVQAFKILK